MKIKEVAKQCGLSEKSIRYYEAMGLLQVKRAENGYREYQSEDILHLQEIALFRSLQASVDDIRLYYEQKYTLDEFLSILLVKQQESINATLETISFTKKMQAHHDAHDVSLHKYFMKRKGILAKYKEVEEIELLYLSKGKQGKRNLLLIVIIIFALGFLINIDFNKDVVIAVLLVTLAIMVLIHLFPASYEYAFRIVKLIFKTDTCVEQWMKMWEKIFPNRFVRCSVKILFLILLLLLIISIVYILSHYKA